MDTILVLALPASVVLGIWLVDRWEQPRFRKAAAAPVLLGVAAVAALLFCLLATSLAFRDVNWF